MHRWDPVEAVTSEKINESGPKCENNSGSATVLPVNSNSTPNQLKSIEISEVEDREDDEDDDVL